MTTSEALAGVAEKIVYDLTLNVQMTKENAAHLHYVIADALRAQAAAQEEDIRRLTEYHSLTGNQLLQRAYAADALAVRLGEALRQIESWSWDENVKPPVDIPALLAEIPPTTEMP